MEAYKAVYWLDDASPNWFLSVKEELLKLDCKQSQLDKALFRWYNNGKLEGVFVMHVDDFLFAGSDAFNRNVIDRMVNTYKIGRGQIESFRYVGLNISQCESGIRVNQEEYVAEMEEIPVTYKRKSDKSSPLTKAEMQSFRATAGQLNWVATQTRPDVSYDALELNMNMNNATVEQMLRANKSVRHAKSATGDTLFPNLGPVCNWKIKVFCDAS